MLEAVEVDDKEKNEMKSSWKEEINTCRERQQAKDIKRQQAKHWKVGRDGKVKNCHALKFFLERKSKGKIKGRYNRKYLFFLFIYFFAYAHIAILNKNLDEQWRLGGNEQTEAWDNE